MVELKKDEKSGNYVGLILITEGAAGEGAETLC